MFVTGDRIDFVKDIELKLYCKGEGVSLAEINRIANSRKKKINIFNFLIYFLKVQNNK